MKYINKREDFLKKSKHDKIGKLIKEAAGGPFTNDIPWGDSLVGRLINAIVRKSGIAINVTRIKKLIPRLKELFDEILEDSKLSKESQVKVWKLKVFALLQKLKKAVDNEEEINVLVYITDDLITIVDSDYIDDENKKTLLDELKKFKEFLLSLKDESPEEEEKEEEEEEEEEEKEEVKPVSKNTQEIPFDFCIKNLKAVYAIILAYKKAMAAKGEAYLAKKDSTGKEIKVGDEYTYNNIKVKVIDLRNPKNYGDDKKWLTDDDTLGTGTMADNNVYVVDISKDKPGNTGYPAIVNKLKPITESTTPVKPIKPNSVAPKQNSIFSAIAPVYNLFKNYPDVFKELESIFNPKQSTDLRNKYLQKHKSPLLKVYNTVRLNEGLTEVLTRPEDLGKALITMYKSTKVKEDGSFEGIQDDMKLAIADFNKTMKSILLFQSGVAEKPKKEGEVETKTETKPVETQTKKEDDIDFDNKNRSDFSSVKLLKYNSFMSINEADEATPATQAQSEPVQGTQSQTQGQSQVQGTQSQVEATTNAQKIKDYFEKNVNYNVWAVELSEVKRIDTEIEQESKDNTELIINGIDPIIEILKLFNRAYKLHTTNNIPGGRSGGAVSRSVYNEYTPFGGSGSGQSGISDGPYRNNKIFNVWENAVLDIMKERKYQPIFSKETKIRIGNQLVKGAGSTFKKLITNLLDTEKLYNNGAQKKFLNEYFGPDAVPEGTSLGLPGDEKVNGDVSENIKELEYDFIKSSELTDNLDIKEGATKPTKFNNKVLQIKSTDGTIYMFVENSDNTYLYVSYSNSFYFFNSYIREQIGAPTKIKSLSSIKTSKKTLDNQDYSLKYTKISITDFVKLIKGGSNITLNSVTVGGNIENSTMQNSLVSFLAKTDDKSLFTLKLDKLQYAKSQVGGSNDVVNLLKGKYGDPKVEQISKVN